MAQTLVPRPGGVAPAPRAPTVRRPHRPALGRRAIWAWAAILVAVVAALGLAIATFVDTGETDVVTAVHTGLMDNGSIRAIEGTVETAVVVPHTGLMDNGSIRAVEGTVETAVVVPHTGLMDNGSIRAVEGTVEDMVTLDAHRGLMENGTIRAIEGTVETASPTSAG